MSLAAAISIINLTDGNFASISVSALNSPIIPSADLSSTTINAQTNGGAATLTVLVSQTNVSVATITKLLSTFNALIGTKSSTVMTNYIGAANTAFDMTTQIAMAALDPIVDTAGPIRSGLTPLTFSETEKYVITYGAGHGTQSNSLTAQIIDAPKPAAAVVFGVGLLGLGLTRRQSKAG